MQHSAARNVREVTSNALELLTSADEVVQSEYQSQGMDHQPMEIILTKDDEETKMAEEDDEVEVHFTYKEFEKLLNAGKITTSQMRSGRVKKQELKAIQEFLDQDNTSIDQPNENHDLTVDEMYQANIDCGLKRVDSKRYKRDYVIIRNSPQVSRKHWEVRSSSTSSAPVVSATPAGRRVDPHSEMDLHQTEEQVNCAFRTFSSWMGIKWYQGIHCVKPESIISVFFRSIPLEIHKFKLRN